MISWLAVFGLGFYPGTLLVGLGLCGYLFGFATGTVLWTVVRARMDQKRRRAR